MVVAQRVNPKVPINKMQQMNKNRARRQEIYSKQQLNKNTKTKTDSPKDTVNLNMSSDHKLKGTEQQIHSAKNCLDH